MYRAAKLVIDAVQRDTLVVIPSAQQKARLAESVVGGIILRKSARQNHMLTRLERNPVNPNMTIHSASMKMNNQK